MSRFYFLFILPNYCIIIVIRKIRQNKRDGYDFDVLPSPVLLDNMIIAYSKIKIKNFNQKIYDDFINSIHVSTILCSTCNMPSFHFHGTYSRSITINTIKISIKVTRVKCKHCNKTHAILCAPIIPYISISNDDLIELMTIPEESILEFNHIRYFKNKIKTICLLYIDLCRIFSRNYDEYFISIPIDLPT